MQNHRSSQAKLAAALVDSLGLDGAIHVCRANGWDGVLTVLLGRNGPKGTTTGAPGPRIHT